MYIFHLQTTAADQFLQQKFLDQYHSKHPHSTAVHLRPHRHLQQTQNPLAHQFLEKMKPRLFRNIRKQRSNNENSLFEYSSIPSSLKQSCSQSSSIISINLFFWFTLAKDVSDIAQSFTAKNFTQYYFGRRDPICEGQGIRSNNRVALQNNPGNGAKKVSNFVVVFGWSNSAHRKFKSSEFHFHWYVLTPFQNHMNLITTRYSPC